ncbi:mannose-1-phosphate guanylyltransferase/mannose-6-phosphate isomerase [Desulfovibrio sp. OttesenSCG-928-C14]|nr:mannose-1-phosphate guanylyltransferase/mannose-6-phosphate isomerase [Desulfovibrio sp. OttesenSCG-928-C14]
MPEIVPVILSGGSGTRLWPLSRGQYPKQFMDLGSGHSLFAETLRRVRALPKAPAPVVICNQEHRFLAARILQAQGWLADGPEQGPQGARLILEPEGRNTAPALALGAFAALERHPQGDPLLLALPADHLIAPVNLFLKSVFTAAPAAQDGYIATFGIQPERPETGFGYILRGREINPGDWPGVFAISSFVEKPALSLAEKLLASGNCYWNSGMFLCKASVYLEELGKFEPEILAAAQKSWEGRKADLDFLRVDAESFKASPAKSVDYAVMEKTSRSCVARLEARWRDLGSWESFYEGAAHDQDGNTSVGDVVLKDAQNCYVHSSSRLVAGIGLKDLILVESADAVLALPRGRGQEVGALLAELKKDGRAEITTHLKVHRPWGSYETLVLAQRFQVKRIIVLPGASLSLQMHHHRAEHWIVVQGTAKVRIGDREEMLPENASIYVPLGEKHQLINSGHINLEIIEVQTGSYLGEDDIQRFEDSYNRS